MEENEQSELSSNLKIFIECVCEEKIYPIEDVLNACIVLLQQVPACRLSVFQFFDKLIDEYCYEYCIANTNVNNPTIDKRKTLPILATFIQALNENKTGQSDDFQRKTSETNNGKLESIDDCPQSPTKENSMDCDIEELSNGNSILKENDLSFVMSLLDKHFSRIGNIFKQLFIEDKDAVLNDLIFEWSLELASEISKNYSNFVIVSDSSHINSYKLDNLSLMSSLSFWIQCPVIQVLIETIFAYVDKPETKTLIIDRLLKYSPHSDWILAYLFTNVSKNLTDYIEQLINNASSYSVIYILSYVSEHNPYAIVNCSKSNLPFLLKLCTNSKPLLDLLARDVVKNVDVKLLNRLAESQDFEDINDCVLYCLLNAPNAFELLKLSFDLVVHPNAKDILSNRILSMLSMVVLQIHKYVYGTSETNNSTNNTDNNTFLILALLRNNIKHLISHQSISRNTSLKKIQLRLLTLVCIFYGTEFISEVFHHLINVGLFAIDVSNYDNPKINPLILPLLTSLRLHVGHNIENCIKDTLKLHFAKELNFWAFFMTFTESNSMPALSVKLEIDDLIKYLNENLYDDNCYQSIFKEFYLLKIISKVFENNPRLYYREQYRLCIVLINVYFVLIKRMQIYNNQYLVVIMNSIVTCQKLLSNLASNFYLNEYTILRSLLDLIQNKNELFLDKYYKSDSNLSNYHCSNLLNNKSFLNYDNFKLKKNPLLPFYKENIKKECIENSFATINRQLLIDVFQSCIKDKKTFSKNFVNSLSHELLQNDMPWFDEDPKDGQIQHLRLTFEKDLSISRLFEEKPILWNILEIVCKGEYLKHCLVLIRALINVQRANLASSSLSNKNIMLTQRIVSLISNNEILPRKPFIYIKELVPKIKPWEISYVLHDIVKYIRDSSTDSSNHLPLKPYLERLRIIMAHHEPSELFVKILKSM